MKSASVKIDVRESKEVGIGAKRDGINFRASDILAPLIMLSVMALLADSLSGSVDFGWMICLVSEPCASGWLSVI